MKYFHCILLSAGQEPAAALLCRTLTLSGQDVAELLLEVVWSVVLVLVLV